MRPPAVLPKKNGFVLYAVINSHFKNRIAKLCLATTLASFALPSTSWSAEDCKLLFQRRFAVAVADSRLDILKFRQLADALDAESKTSSSSALRYAALALRSLEDLEIRNTSLQEGVLSNGSIGSNHGFKLTNDQIGVERSATSARLQRVLKIYRESIRIPTKDFEASSHFFAELSPKSPEYAGMRDLVVSEQQEIARLVRESLVKIRPELLALTKLTGDSAILEIGPTESRNFNPANLEKMVRMYTLYAEKKGWKVSILNEDFVNGERRKIHLQVEGKDALALLGFERGDHRFYEVDDGSVRSKVAGKVYDRYVQVKVYRPPQDQEFIVDTRRLRFETMRASGPGGQHVNKTDSGVRAIYTLEDGSELVAKVTSSRSQHENKKSAIALIGAKLLLKHQEDAARELRASRQGSRVNTVILAEGDRWTRTYDFRENNRQTEHLLNGDLDSVLSSFADRALILRLTEFRSQLSIGEWDQFLLPK